MSALGLDLGGTKLASALFSSSGRMSDKRIEPLNHKSGESVGNLITDQIQFYLSTYSESIHSIGISVPGISRHKSGTVWAPNIPEWQDYPLLARIKAVVGDIPVWIESDRACCILGEVWQGNAQGCTDAIFLTIGTGIGAGILSGNRIIRGAHDISGAIGWMALHKPYDKKYVPCGCFEYYASGEGIVKRTNELLTQSPSYAGELKDPAITAHHVFTAYDEEDPLARVVIHECIQYWGMAAANLISIFNPEKIIFGGGVFGPAIKFIDAIKQEASLWAQPISMTQVSFEKSGVVNDTALFGAAYLALNQLPSS